MKARIFIILVFALALTHAFGQGTDNTLYVKQFPGVTVGQKATAAQAACSSNLQIPCIIVFDPSLAAYAAGTMPGKCSNCIWQDWRSAQNAPASSAGLLRSSMSRILTKMQRGVEDVYWVHFGDSMSYDYYATPIYRWMYDSARIVGANFPAYTVKYRVWDATTCTASVTVANGGSSYQTGDVVTVVQSGASGCQYTVAQSGGVVTSLTLAAGGENYSPANGLATTGGNGSGLTVNLTFTGSWGSSTNGSWQTAQTGNSTSVVNAFITSAGSGQTTGTYTVNATGGGGTGAQISVVISSGTCNSIQVINGGTGYSSVPTFTVAAGGTPCTVQGVVVPTLWISNASYPGMTTQFDLGTLGPMLAGAFPTPINRIPNARTSYTPDLVTIAQGYNQGTAAGNWAPDMLALTETAEHLTIGAPIVIMAEPWACSPAGLEGYPIQRSSAYELVAASRGYGFLNVGQAFHDSSPTNWCSYLNSDGIHPNDVGSALWANLFASAWVFNSQIPPGAGQQSTMDTPNSDQLATNGTFQVTSSGTPVNWTLSSGTSATDNTNYLSPNGYAIKVTGSGTTAALTQSLPLAKVRGQWVSVWAMEFVPTGQYTVAQTMYAGQVALSDSLGQSVSTQTTTDQANGFGAWHLVGVCRYISPSATNPSVTLYGSVGTVASAASFDSVSVTIGCFPTIAPYAPATPFDQTKGSYTWGGDGGANMYHKYDAAAGAQKATVFQTASKNRWVIGTDANAESGADAGTGFLITAAHDDGTSIDNPLLCTRAAGGVCVWARPLTAPSMVFTTAAPSTAAGQTAFGSTTAAASNCGSLSGAAGCLVININGTTHYVPYW